MHKKSSECVKNEVFDTQCGPPPILKQSLQPWIDAFNIYECMLLYLYLCEDQVSYLESEDMLASPHFFKSLFEG